MIDMAIGRDVVRIGRTVYGAHIATLAHLVESTIEDRAVTKCGRQMHQHTAKGDLYVVGEVTGATGDRCSVCHPSPA